MFNPSVAETSDLTFRDFLGGIASLVSGMSWVGAEGGILKKNYYARNLISVDELILELHHK